MDLFAGLGDDIAGRASALFAELDSLPLETKVQAINQIKKALHQRSPFAGEPVDCVLWVQAETVVANTWNPNHVASPEMRLLQLSIEADGYTQPIVTNAEDHRYEVVDGFHRARVGKEARKVRDRVHGYLPVVAIKSNRTDANDRMAATIRHNRARGVHGVVPMVDLVAKLITQGWADSDVCRELGMDSDEVLRLKQASGIAALFKDRQYSRSWAPGEKEE